MQFGDRVSMIRRGKIRRGVVVNTINRNYTRDQTKWEPLPRNHVWVVWEDGIRMDTDISRDKLTPGWLED